MSHEIESMFSVGELPWHGLGHVLDTAPSCAEALVLAGLNWQVGLRPLATTAMDGGVSVAVESHRAVMRMDTGAVLGVVGDDFRPFGNADAFAFFFRVLAWVYRRRLERKHDARVLTLVGEVDRSSTFKLVRQIRATPDDRRIILLIDTRGGLSG